MKPLMLNRQRNQRPARLELPAASRISTVRELTARMAALARLLHDALPLAMAEEGRHGPLRQEWLRYAAATDADLTAEGFYDLYTQAICYALFATRCRQRNGERFLLQHAAYHLAHIPGVLRETFRQFTGTMRDEAYLVVVDSLVDLLERTDITAICRELSPYGSADVALRRFAVAFSAVYSQHDAQPDSDALPSPVISYLVRSVDALLRDVFELDEGLACGGTRLTLNSAPAFGIVRLDPGAGADALLHEVCTYNDHPHDYTCLHLTPCRQGFTVQHIPGAQAQRTLGLRQTRPDRHLRVMLTQPPRSVTALPTRPTSPLLVLLGTTSAAGDTVQRAEEIIGLLQEHPTELPTASIFPPAPTLPAGHHAGRLRDEQIPAIGYAPWLFTGASGVLAFVSSRAYLDHPACAELRDQLLRAFDDLYILAIENEATVINLFVKRTAAASDMGLIHYTELGGTPDDQRAWLQLHALHTTTWAEVAPAAPQYCFTR